MPHKVDVVCPDCSANAVFEFAEVVKISLKKDIDYFKASKFFEYRLFQDGCGHRWHGAIFYHGLHSANNIKDLPEGYSMECFQHSQYWTRSHNLDIGAVCCTACGSRKKAKLNWPKDAYYQCEIRGDVLWGFNRQSLTELRDFIQSDSREEKKYTYQSFLRHIPSVFLQRKNRERVVAKLDRLLK